MNIRRIRNTSWRRTSLLYTVSMTSSTTSPHDCMSMLSSAVMCNIITRTQLLIAHGADVNVDYGYPIRCAAYRNYDIILDILITAGADLNLCGEYTPTITNAISRSPAKTVLKLLMAGAVPPRKCVVEHLTYVDVKEKTEILEAYNRNRNKK